jgi:hypothetical protein
MVQNIVNGAPQYVAQGIDDVSTRQVPATPEVLPTHLPKVWTYGSMGPSDPQLLSGAAIGTMFGSGALDMRSKYATHMTQLINTLSDAGNAVMVQRLIPADAAPAANVRYYLDVLPTQVDEYTRNIDGSYKLDANGDPIPTGTKITGFKVKWVALHIAPGTDGADMFGQGTILPGDQTDAASGTQSERYPIFDLAFPHQGSAGNAIGLRFTAPTEASSTGPSSISLGTDRVYPFRLQVLQKQSANVTPSIVNTQAAEAYVNFTLKPGQISSQTDALTYLGSVFPKKYQLLNDPSGLPNIYGPCGRMKIYQANIDSLLTQFYEAEKPFIDAFSDFNAENDDASEKYLFNLFTGVSSQNVFYHSFLVDTTSTKAVRFTENSLVYYSGGSDGTMSEALFAELVSADVKRYADPLSELLDDARYPESIIYDSGFPLQTKYDLLSALAIRKDIAVILSTHDVLGDVLTASEESALAVALRTRAANYPESDYFGTGVTRCAIIGRCGTMINSLYDKPLPLAIEFASKMAKYMGAGSGVWNGTYAFDGAPGNQVELFTDVNVTYTPVTVRNKDWDNGLVWVQYFDRRSLFWPAFKSVYNNDTSVLTSIITVMGCVEAEKVGQRAWRQFTGNSSLTDLQLIDRVGKFVEANTNQRFDSRFVIQPDVYFTDADTARGYSWSLKIRLYANNMKTVQTLSIATYRMSDLTATS